VLAFLSGWKLPGTAGLPAHLSRREGDRRDGARRTHSRRLIFEMSARAADVIAFYEKSTAEAGFVQTTDGASSSTLSFAAASHRSVRITAEPIAGGSHVQIV
jgi:hypothetical protein